MDIKFAIVTASDTRDLAQDTAGAALEALITENPTWTVVSHVVVKDDRESLGAAIVTACDESGANIVLTCGGTGLSLRDVTPEATMDVCDRNVPGIAEAIRAGSMQKTKRAMLSRALCMQRGPVLVHRTSPAARRPPANAGKWWRIKLDHAMKMTAGGGH